ncbi:MAG: hypothetical protein J7L63_02730 [Thermoplasmata archaeon]|nr:hypothetical protein [Thermoplasmata archaeon]
MIIIFGASLVTVLPVKSEPIDRTLGFTFDHYPSYEEMNHTIHQMAQQYSSIMKVFSIGKTWGWNPEIKVMTLRGIFGL